MKVDTTLLEGIAGTWHYHLAKDGKSLCGAKTMSTQVPVHTWGVKGHLNERYCSKCEELSKGDVNALEPMKEYLK